MDIKRLAVPLLGAALIGGAAAGVGLTALAADSSSSSTSSGQAAMAHNRGPGMMGGGVEGTVTAVNGSSITVTAKDGGVYTIDASDATVDKYVNGASTTVGASSLAVGDTVMVGGKITTASLSATEIRDNFPQPTPPAAMGKVTAVNGTTITVSGMAPSATKPVAGTKPVATTYTVDASSATITKVAAPTTAGTSSTSLGAGKPTEATITAAQISVGDMLEIDGTLSGTSVSATTIRDGAGFGMGGTMHGPGK